MHDEEEYDQSVGRVSIWGGHTTILAQSYSVHNGGNSGTEHNRRWAILAPAYINLRNSRNMSARASIARLIDTGHA